MFGMGNREGRVLIRCRRSPKTKEAMLYILKQVLDERTDLGELQDGHDKVQNFDQAMDFDSARMLMDYVSLAMQDGMN